MSFTLDSTKWYIPHRTENIIALFESFRDLIIENVYLFHAFINPIPSLFWSRNFPQGTISDMVTDASQGISFVCNNISAFGGDPNR